MITSEMVSIPSVGLPAIGGILSAIISFLGVLPGGLGRRPPRPDEPGRSGAAADPVLR